MKHNLQMDSRKSTARLGRGLAALIGDTTNEMEVIERARSNRRVPIGQIVASHENPREYFDEERLSDLSSSIREKGLLQPLIVRELPERDARRPRVQYEIVVGERRWRASMLAGMTEIPVIVSQLGDQAALEVALIENIQRADLDPIEEAKTYRKLIEKYDCSQEQVAKKVGKSRPHIANCMRLLNLPNEVAEKIIAGELSASHGRTLLATPNPIEAMHKILNEGLSVRDVEEMARQSAKPNANPENKHAENKHAEITDASNADLDDCSEMSDKAQMRSSAVKVSGQDLVQRAARTLNDRLGMEVDVRPRKNRSSGEIRIKYRSKADLDKLLSMISND